MQDQGFGIVSQVFSEGQVFEMLDKVPDLKETGGTRSLLDHQWCLELTADPNLIEIVENLIGSPARPRRAILFDKSENSNWTLGWHQDTKIAVKERVDGIEGYGNFSVKEGVTHLQPPTEILRSSVAIRIHLDRCDESNGALKVIPNSHLKGVRHQIEPSEDANQVTLEVDAGDIIWMRPLVFHSSGKSTNPSHRRVIHIEYCSLHLPEPLDWRW